MPMAPITSQLSGSSQRLLADMVKPKFDSYFRLTSSASGIRRAVPDPNGQPWFVYPKEIMIPDLTFLWSVFADVHQILGGSAKMATFVHGDPFLTAQFRSIVEGDSEHGGCGEFWHFPGGRVPLQGATGQELAQVLRTLRNGFAHSHWLFDDLSAIDYWNALEWETGSAPPEFNIERRPRKNYTIYIADGCDFRPDTFWRGRDRDLRILVTSAHLLWYDLHRFLNYLLFGSKENILHE
jgi:hypothetical protein